jgi:hypothetical protein
MKAYYGFVFLSLFLLSSCATIFSGTRDQLLFTSEPSGAKIIMDGRVIGKTPVMLDVRRRLGGLWVGYELEGFKSQFQQLDTEFNAVSIINLSCILCWGIDAATGALVRYAMPGVYMQLEPLLPETIRRPE